MLRAGSYYVVWRHRGMQQAPPQEERHGRAAAAGFRGLLPAAARQENSSSSSSNNNHEVWLMYGRGPVFRPPEGPGSSSSEGVSTLGQVRNRDEAARWHPLDS